ncbi:hypothetical protein [Pseudoduganella namucuonensis]|uniref:hypothetical protein n=1 Tax=Pseudoduganella namucuonensis TaxID=1035707 RepID=UPI000B81393E|nr:hypothetical protein [Pseudoduganella namucuonensis]
MSKTNFAVIIAKATVCTVALAFPLAASAYPSPHVVQGVRVGDNKYKVIGISNMKCAQMSGQKLPYEERGGVDALVCNWSSSQPGGKAFIVLNKAVPDTLTVKFYTPSQRVGEVTAVYPASVGYDKLRAEFGAAPYKEIKPAKGQPGEAYWVDGELLTRLSCGKKECTVTSGSNYDKAFKMTEADRAAAREARRKGDAGKEGAAR